ncbi:MAG: tetratricopeptide repeat protein [Rhodomicrobium sp.]
MNYRRDGSERAGHTRYMRAMRGALWFWIGALAVAGGAALALPASAAPTPEASRDVEASPEAVQLQKEEDGKRAGITKLIESGEASCKDREYGRAIAAYTEAIDLDQKNARAYALRSLAYSRWAYGRKIDWALALGDAEKAVALDPGLALAHAALSRVSAGGISGYADRGIEEANRAIDIDPELADAYDARGLAYAKKKDYGHAIADYTRAIELNPANADAYITRGNVYYNNYNVAYNTGIEISIQDYDHAIADFSQAIAVDPKYARAYAVRGAAYSTKGDYDFAIADFTKIMGLNSKHADAYHMRGDAYLRRKNFDLAIADYSQAIGLIPNDGMAYFGRSQAFKAKGDADRATADFKRAEELGWNRF